MIPKISRKKTFLYRLLFDYVSVGLLFFQGIIFVPIYLNYIDKSVYGFWLGTGAVVSSIGIFDFGVGPVLIQKISKYYSENKYHKIGPLITTGVSLSLLFAIIPLIIGVILGNILPEILVSDEEIGGILGTAFLLACISASIMLVAYTVGNCILGLQRSKWLGIINSVSTILSLLLILILLNNGFDILSIPIALLTRAVFILIGNVVYLILIVNPIFGSYSFKINLAIVPGIMNNSLWTFSSQLSNIILQKYDNIVILIFLGPIITTVFVMTKRAAEFLGIIALRIASAIMPLLANMSDEEDRKFERYSLLTMIASFLIIAFLMGGYFIYNEYFVRLWLGQEFYAGSLVTLLIGIFMIITVINNSVYNILYSKGEITYTGKINLLTLTLKIISSIPLIFLLGLPGIVIASILSVIASTILMVFKVETGYQLFKCKINSVVKILMLIILFQFSI